MEPLLYIVRHGQTDWNAEQRLQGQAEVDLNSVGLAQVKQNAAFLADIIEDPAIFDFASSPLRRAQDTMRSIRSGLGLPQDGYRTDDRLKELHFGDWQGFTYAELEQNAPGSTRGRGQNKWHFTPPGVHAENYAQLAVRANQWLRDVARPTICATHGGIIRTLFHLINGLDTEEAANLPIPQDRVLCRVNGHLEWL